MKTQVVILLSFIVGISCSTKSNEEEITTDRSNWDHLTELEFPEAYPHSSCNRDIV
jgi:archaellum component FlaD/FlaE